MLDKRNKTDPMISGGAAVDGLEEGENGPPDPTGNAGDKPHWLRTRFLRVDGRPLSTLGWGRH